MGAQAGKGLAALAATSAVAVAAAVVAARARRPSAAACAESRGPEGQGVRVASDLSYGEDPRHRLDLYLPSTHSPQSARLPLVVFIHGGLLCSGDKREGERIARLLASRAGVVAASVTYRVSADSASPLRHPQHLADVARALRWLAVVGAADYAIDPLRTVLIGHSVGAWLAALIALTPARANLDDVPLRVVGVVGVQSLFDLRKFYREEPPWRKYLDRSLPADRWQWDLPEASVADGAARRDVAWLLLHSMQDPWVDVSQSHQFADALRRGGAQRVMLSLAAEGGAHDEALRRIGDAENDWTRSLLSFVDSVTARV